MTSQQKRQVIVVGTTTAIGFFANVLSYSLKLPKQKGEGFQFAFPKGIELTYVLVIGFVAGVVVNKVLEKIEDSFKTPEEKLLAEAYAKAEEEAQRGIVSQKKPSIVWT
jgi:hypothetical protein